MATKNNAMKEFVITVDKHNQAIGQEEKLMAHRTGVLHRAFSVFIFNQHQELLLQKRALTKYHSAGLWTNTCCGHPRPGETTPAAAQRRLFEETGIHCPLSPAGVITYHAHLTSSNLIEHEVDHLFYGFFDGAPMPNPQEIDEIRWEPKEKILQELQSQPNNFTAWFEPTLHKIYQTISNS